MADQTPAHRASPIAAGDIAPDFTLPDQSRADFSLSEAVRGGDVVLCFFPFAFTGVCGTEMGCISRDMAAWQAKGARVVGISCDSPFALKAWAAAEGFQHTLLSDQHRSVTRSYGLHWADMNTTRRATVIVSRSEDGKGKVKFVEAREPGSAMDWDKVMTQM